IRDARFQDELVDQAKKAGKLDPRWEVPPAARRNTAEQLEHRFAEYRSMFPDYPFGSDFTQVEQRLIPALERLQQLSHNKWALLRALLKGRPGQHVEELERLGLAAPSSLKERIYARLVAAVLTEG